MPLGIFFLTLILVFVSILCPAAFMHYVRELEARKAEIAYYSSFETSEKTKKYQPLAQYTYYPIETYNTTI